MVTGGERISPGNERDAADSVLELLVISDKAMPNEAVLIPDGLVRKAFGSDSAIFSDVTFTTVEISES